MGRRGFFNPERERRSASESTAMASFWPMTRLPSSSSMRSSFWASSSSRLVMGMPVQVATTSAMSLSLTTSSRPVSLRHEVRATSNSCCNVMRSTLKLAARS